LVIDDEHPDVTHGGIFSRQHGGCTGGQPPRGVRL